MMTDEKRQWLQENGYLLTNDEIIHEAAYKASHGDPKGLKTMLDSIRARYYKYYKRYGDTIMHYSEEYLAKLTIEEIMEHDARNKEWFNDA